MATAYLELYQNRRTGDYLIQRYLNSYGVGKFIRISATEMQDHGLQLILAVLEDQRQPRDSEQPELTTFSKAQERAFHREHPHVFVHLSPDGVIKIGPLQRKGSGFVAPREGIVELCPPFTNADFVDALNRAYAAVE